MLALSLFIVAGVLFLGGMTVTIVLCIKQGGSYQSPPQHISSFDAYCLIKANERRGW